jgi:hypothetical protein
MKKEVAETICGMLDDVLEKLQAFNNYINENSDSVPIERFRSAVGVCVAELDLKILDSVYRQFPHLKPPHLP